MDVLIVIGITAGVIAVCALVKWLCKRYIDKKR